MSDILHLRFGEDKVDPPEHIQPLPTAHDDVAREKRGDGGDDLSERRHANRGIATPEALI